MAKNRTKNRNGMEKTEQAARRLGFRSLNRNKSDFLSVVMEKAIILKNAISSYCSVNKTRLFDDYSSFVADYKLFNIPKYTAHGEVTLFSAKEIQDMFQEIATAYLNQFEQRLDNLHPFVQTGYSRTAYQRGKNKGKTKTWELKKKKSDIQQLARFVVKFPVERWGAIKEKGKPGTVVVIKTIENHKHKDRILKTAANIRQIIIQSVKKGVYTTGTHRKYFSTTGKDELCKVYFDSENTENQWWLRLYFGKKTDNHVLHLPIAVNQNYFDLTKFENKSSFLLKEQSKGKFVFIFAEERKVKEIKVPEITFENTAGIDVNATGDILATTEDGANQKIDTVFFNKKLKIILDAEKEKNNLVGQKKDYSKPLRKMNKAVSSIEMVIKRHVSSMLDAFQKVGIKHAAIEDLTLFDTRSSFIRIEEFDGIKISKLVRKLRLSNVGTWIEQQARKRGITVHRVPAAYTSQRCPYCAFTDRENRLNKNTFHCLDCGNLNQADYNSSLNIKLIAVVGVLRAELLKLDKNGRFVPKSNKKDFVKNGYQRSEFSLFASHSKSKAPEVRNLLPETRYFNAG